MGRGSPQIQIAPKNANSQNTAPSPKNQNSAVAQKACSVATRRKLVKNAWVNSHAGTRRKSALKFLSQRVGMVGIASAAATLPSSRRLGALRFFDWVFLRVAKAV